MSGTSHQSAEALRCADVRDLMQAALDDPQHVGAVTTHVRGCATCAKVWQELNDLADELSRAVKQLGDSATSLGTPSPQEHEEFQTLIGPTVMATQAHAAKGKAELLVRSKLAREVMLAILQRGRTQPSTLKLVAVASATATAACLLTVSVLSWLGVFSPSAHPLTPPADVGTPLANRENHPTLPLPTPPDTTNLNAPTPPDSHSANAHLRQTARVAELKRQIASLCDRTLAEWHVRGRGRPAQMAAWASADLRREWSELRDQLRREPKPLRDELAQWAKAQAVEKAMPLRLFYERVADMLAGLDREDDRDKERDNSSNR